MRIKLDDTHYLESDSMNLWIRTEHVSKNGKPYSRIVTGYYRRVEDLIEDYIDRSILKSKATSFAGLKREIASLKKRIDGWKDVITLEGFNEKEPPKKKARRKASK